MKSILIDFFSKYKQEKLKDAIDLVYSKSTTTSLEDYVQLKFDYLRYTMPDLYEWRPAYLIRLVIAGIQEESTRNELAGGLKSADFKHLKQAAASYDKKNCIFTPPPSTHKAMSYDVQQYLKELSKARNETQFEAQANSNFARRSSIRNLSEGLLNRLNHFSSSS